MCSIVLAAFALLLASAPSAFAASVTYVYSGSVVSNSVAGADAQFLGQDWTATLTFDDTTPATSPASSVFPNPTNYLGGISFLAIEFTSGVVWNVVESFGGILQVGNDLETRPGLLNDRFTAQASFQDSPAALAAAGLPSLVLTLVDYDYDVFDTVALPSVQLDVADFGLSAGTLIFPSGNGSVGLNVESMTISSIVPEPTSALLLGLGLAGLAHGGRRRDP